MSSRFVGKTAFITGAARGQGRAHAVRFAQEGANVVATDACADVDGAAYPMASDADLRETTRLVQRAGGRIVTAIADVRSQDQLDEAAGAGIAEFGSIDVVCANAGVSTFARAWELDEATWSTVLDINLSGVWRTVKAVVPSMISQQRGGSIVITSSAGGRKGVPNAAHYVSSKHGVVGLMRTLANELATYDIRVNTVHTTAVDTPMIQNDATYRLFCPELQNPTRAQAQPRFAAQNPLGVPWLDPVEVSNAILWLASDQARYVTGAEIPVDAGFHGRV